VLYNLMMLCFTPPDWLWEIHQLVFLLWALPSRPFPPQSQSTWSIMVWN